MKDITVIIPIHKFDDKIKETLSKAVESVKSQKEKVSQLMLVVTEETKEDVSELIKTIKGDLAITIVLNKGKTSIQSQINCGVKHCETTHFSILEFDDTYSQNWFKNVKEYSKNDDFSLYLPIIKLFNEDGSFIGLANNEVWASSFSEEIGKLDNEVLMYYQFIKTSGMVMDKKTFEEIGGLKENIKVSFWYEFLLRLTENDKIIFVIPKFGYNHTLDRRGGYVDETYKKLSKEEILFWYETAKVESCYIEDRKVVYNG